VFGGLCRKSEGWVGSTWEEYIGHEYRQHGYVGLAEVMVRSVGKPLFYVVHPDDLTVLP
jgi:hypothetical protein